MKKLILTALLLVCGIGAMMGQEKASIKFEKTVHNFGVLSIDSSRVTCVFPFINAGNEPLVINQAFASCGCTSPQFPKAPIMPGERGEIKVTYDGRRSSVGHFRKYITVRTNGEIETSKLYVEGDIVAPE